MSEKKKCRGCEKEFLKTKEYFYCDKSRKDNLSPLCKSCASIRYRKRYDENPEKYKKFHDRYRKNNLTKTNTYKKKWADENKDKTKNAQLKYRFGITLEEFNSLLNEQNNVCAICKQACPSGNNLCIDHNHKTKKVRGLLCDSCNRGLGCFKENLNIIMSAYEYILGDKNDES